MTFTEALSSALDKYATFSGRARRSEYWFFGLFSFLAGVVATVVDGALGLLNEDGTGPISALTSLALVLPSLAIAVRRLHDLDRTGWWILLPVTIVGIIVLVVWFCTDGTRGPNRFGPDPKRPVSEPGPGLAGPGYGQPGGYGPGSEWGTPPA